MTGADLLGEAECFQLAKPSDLQRMKFVEPDVRIDRRLDDARGMAIADKLAVKLREALGIDLAFQAALDVEVGARP